MAVRHFDTIVAPITPPGRGAVAAVRVSGPDSIDVARKVFSTLPEHPEPRKAVYGRFGYGDDGLALPFEAGGSYTGEAVVEFFVHGSPTSVRLLVAACIDAGARQAEPGEFSLRAFSNGRIDLTQAEAIVEAVDAQTRTHVRAAGDQIAGALSKALTPAQEIIEAVILTYEANLDFSQELGPVDHEAASKELDVALSAVRRALEFETPARLVRQGLRVAILGKPNAGKSSLFNRLAGQDRAIVTPIPGTTRDVLEVTIDVRGIPVTLFDTAGLRETEESVERIGVDRSRETAKRADAVLYLYDCQLGLTEDDRRHVRTLDNPLILASKSDLPHGPLDHDTISAATGEGIANLLDRLVQSSEEIELPYLLNERHVEALREAEAAISEALEAGGDHPDLLLPSLYAAAEQLRRVLGLGVAPDVIERIFAKFCIGK
jgi:tRNA modification GTPase